MSRARQLLADATRVNFSTADIAGAARCTIGGVIPLVIGLSTGAVADGVYAAIGAICAGFASFQGAYRSRAAITVLVGAGMAAATYTGALSGHADWSAVLVVAVWAFVTGMMAALGQTSLLVGLQWGVAAIIVNALPMTDSQALVRSGMVLAGACVQTILVVLVWPIRTYAAERKAIAALYQDLASHAEQITEGTELGAAPVVLDAAKQALRDPHPLGRVTQLLAFQALVDEAERMNIELPALASLRTRLKRAGRDVGEIDRFFSEAAGVLRSVEMALLADKPPAAPVAPSPVRAATVGSGEAAGELSWEEREAARTSEALAGQLRSVLRLVGEDSADSLPNEELESRKLPRAREHDAQHVVLALRSNISWQSSIFRHAVRLFVTVAVAMVIYRLSGLPHGYWIPLTAFLILRPDFSSTTVRGLSRVVGTILGAALATLLVVAVDPDTTGLAVMFAIAIFAAYVLAQSNYALFSMCVTAYVVFLLGFEKLPALATAGDRAVDTLIGGVLAVLVYLAWPTWEARLIGQRLTEFLDSQADYADGVLGCFSEPSSAKRPQLGEMRAAVRRARSNAELSVERMASEPGRSKRDAPVSLEQARGVIAACRRGSLALLTLHAHLPEKSAEELPPVRPFTEMLTAHIRNNAAALGQLGSGRDAGGGRTPEERAAYVLRAAYRELVEKLSAFAYGDDASIPILSAESDELVDSVNSVSDLLSPQ